MLNMEKNAELHLFPCHPLRPDRSFFRDAGGTHANRPPDCSGGLPMLPAMLLTFWIQRRNIRLGNAEVLLQYGQREVPQTAAGNFGVSPLRYVRRGSRPVPG